MAERDPYDFSALAPGFDLDEDSPPLELPALTEQQSTLSEEALSELADFEADLESMAGEGFALPPPDPALDEEFRKFQAALSHLQDSLLDLELEAEEAFLASLIAEEAADESAALPPLAGLLGPDFHADAD